MSVQGCRRLYGSLADGLTRHHDERPNQLEMECITFTGVAVLETVSDFGSSTLIQR